jgi:hypothetical protein
MALRHGGLPNERRNNVLFSRGGGYRERFNLSSISRYAGHMFRRPENLPQTAVFIARPKERDGKKDRNPGGCMGCTEFRIESFLWKELFRQALTSNWLQRQISK